MVDLGTTPRALPDHLLPVNGAPSLSHFLCLSGMRADSSKLSVEP